MPHTGFIRVYEQQAQRVRPPTRVRHLRCERSGRLRKSITARGQEQLHDLVSADQRVHAWIAASTWRLHASALVVAADISGKPVTAWTV